MKLPSRQHLKSIPTTLDCVTRLCLVKRCRAVVDSCKRCFRHYLRSTVFPLLPSFRDLRSTKPARVLRLTAALPPMISREATAKVNSPVSYPDQGLSDHLWRQYPCKIWELTFAIASRRIGGGHFRARRLKDSLFADGRNSLCSQERGAYKTRLISNLPRLQMTKTRIVHSRGAKTRRVHSRG